MRYNVNAMSSFYDLKEMHSGAANTPFICSDRINCTQNEKNKNKNKRG